MFYILFLIACDYTYYHFRQSRDREVCVDLNQFIDLLALGECFSKQYFIPAPSFKTLFSITLLFLLS